MTRRLVAVAPGAQLMGAAVNQSAMNVANSLGAAVGGVVIAAYCEPTHAMVYTPPDSPEFPAVQQAAMDMFMELYVS